MASIEGENLSKKNSPPVSSVMRRDRSTSIRLRNYVAWIYKTVRNDLQHYHAPVPRDWSLANVRRTLYPEIHRPVFIVGAPRSGTSFLGRCLAALPELSYHFEPVATKAAARYVYSGQWSPARAERFYRRTYRWLLRLHLAGGRRLAEKTPRNAFLIPFLARAFPEAQFVHILRDGRDAALSHSKKPWLQAAAASSGKREHGGYPFGPVPRFWVEPERTEEFERTTDFHRCIWAWRRHVESILEAAAALPAEQYHGLRYEHLTREPRAEAKRLVDFLGIERANSRRRLFEAVTHVHADSVGNWREELTTCQRRTAEREAGLLLHRLGYLEVDSSRGMPESEQGDE